MSPVPVVGEDDRGQVVYLGECRRHGWHGKNVCQECLKEVYDGRAPARDRPATPGPAPLNGKYRPGDEIVAFNMPRQRFWTDGAKCQREGHCRMCRRPAHVRQLTRHHVIAQDWWRKKGDLIASLRNAAANIVPLCRPCHDAIEADVGQRRMLRRVMTQTEIAFAIDVRGREWFEIRYPV